MADAKLNLAELDFDAIKENLKLYLRSQDEFTDYNFEGSGLTVLLNLLAYNTHYNAYYANMLVNESFLDSAIKRSSIVSRAKFLGYTPRSAKCASAIVDITIAPSGDNIPTVLTLPKGTRFITNNDGIQYSFFCNSVIQTPLVDNKFTFSNVTISEGRVLSYLYVVDKSTNPNLIFEIPNEDVDTSILTVRVQESESTQTTTVFNSATKITNVDGTSNVYWLQENYRGRYEICFGDGVLGSTLQDGNVVYIEYVVSSKDAANGARYFSLVDNVGGYSGAVVRTIQPAQGGAEKESDNSIKFYAPKTFAAQNRIVTLDDYKTFVETNYSNIESTAVWGGEDNDPPVYGKVFISVKTSDSLFVDDALKTAIKNDIKQKSVAPVQVELVNADYLFVGCACSVKVDKSLTPYTTTQLKALIRSSIIQYAEDNLNKFDRDLYYSKLLKKIEETSDAIVSSNVSFRLMKSFIPVIGRNASNALKFNNPIYPGSISSTAFNAQLNSGVVLCVIFDDGNGILSLRNYTTGQTVVNRLGTVNYTDGIVTISSATVVDIPEQDSIFVYANPTKNDINVNKSSIITLDKNSLLYFINREQGIKDVTVEMI